MIHLKAIGAAAASATAIIALLAYFDLVPAFSKDIKKLSRTQAETAVEVYSNKVRSYLVLPEPKNDVARKFLEGELGRAQRQLEAAEKRRIELSK